MSASSLRAVFERYLREFDPDHRVQASNLVLLASVDSTNLLARRILEAYRKERLAVPATLVATLHQRAGRGRLGRSWSSPALEGVYATLICELPGRCLPTTIPLLVAVALCRELDDLLPGGCGLKWPNDLITTGGKIGGVLVERATRGEAPTGVLIGFGINCHQTRDRLPMGRATSILVESGRRVSLGGLTGKLVAGVERELRHCDDAAYAVEVYRRHSIHRPGELMRCRTGEGVVEGVFDGLDARGFLRLRVGTGVKLLSSGEVLVPESPADEVDAHAYFRTIEEVFIRLRGAPLLLSPADWQTAREWHRTGIPLELVCATLEAVFARRRERDERRPVRSLRYCRRAVEAAWEERRELQAGSGRRQADALDVPGRLRALAAALPVTLAGRDRLAERILGLAGQAEQVERQLSGLDDELLAAAERDLEPAVRTQIEERVEAALTRLGERIPPAELVELRARLTRREMRRALGLPLLSLFASEIR